MTERPILFNTEMVRAILDGRKTQTRRRVQVPRWAAYYGKENEDLRLMDEMNNDPHPGELCCAANDGYWYPVPCPFGVPGDRLYVRETCNVVGFVPGYEIHTENGLGDCDYGVAEIRYADGDTKIEDELMEEQEEQAKRMYRKKNTSSLHMPRWASRIDLEVVRVWVERVQDISEDDAWSEGVGCPNYGPEGSPGPGEPHNSTDLFAELWESIYGTWEDNPWVWCCEFRRVD